MTSDWSQQCGRRGTPTHTWTLTVAADLKSCNFGLHSTGIERRTEMHGADLCRQLCPSLCFALDDDDNMYKYNANAYLYAGPKTKLTLRRRSDHGTMPKV